MRWPKMRMAAGSSNSIGGRTDDAESRPLHLPQDRRWRPPWFFDPRLHEAQPPWAEWPEEISSSPPGVERITIARCLDADYDLRVHDFSGTQEFSHGEASVRVTEVPSFKGRVVTPRPGTGRWWHVCRFNGATGRFEEINNLLSECPYSIP